jgi:hypothetical protein
MPGFGPGPGLLDVNGVEAIQRNVDAYMDGARVLKVDAHDWSADPYAKSAWVGFGPGQLTRWGNGIRKPEGRLFFAGPDIATKRAGWIEGAVDLEAPPFRAGRLTVLAKGVPTRREGSWFSPLMSR